MSVCDDKREKRELLAWRKCQHRFPSQSKRHCSELNNWVKILKLTSRWQSSPALGGCCVWRSLHTCGCEQEHRHLWKNTFFAFLLIPLALCGSNPAQEQQDTADSLFGSLSPTHVKNLSTTTSPLAYYPLRVYILERGRAVGGQGGRILSPRVQSPLRSSRDHLARITIFSITSNSSTAFMSKH